MKFNEIKTGTIFTIWETPSYPKLKTNSGYVDLRDEIINNNPNHAVLSNDCRELKTNEIAEKFETTNEEIDSWIKEKKEKFLKVDR